VSFLSRSLYQRCGQGKRQNDLFLLPFLVLYIIITPQMLPRGVKQSSPASAWGLLAMMFYNNVYVAFYELFFGSR